MRDQEKLGAVGRANFQLTEDHIARPGSRGRKKPRETNAITQRRAACGFLDKCHPRWAEAISVLGLLLGAALPMAWAQGPGASPAVPPGEAREWYEFALDLWNALVGTVGVPGAIGVVVLAFILCPLIVGWARYGPETLFNLSRDLIARMWNGSEAASAGNAAQPPPPLVERESESGATPEPVVPFLSHAEQLRAYLEKVRTDCEGLRLGGISTEASDPQKTAAEQRNPLLLREVFVPLEVDRFRDGADDAPDLKGRREKLEWRREERDRLSAIEALAAPEAARAVLLGQPGAGKSSVLRFLAYHHARAYPGGATVQEGLSDWPGEVMLPVPVSLARLAEALPIEYEHGLEKLEKKVRGFVEAEIEAHEDLRGFGTRFWQELREHGALFLFDGLDEVAPEKRHLVKRALVDFLTTRPDWRAVVTCRTYSYVDPEWRLEEWPAYTLEPLRPAQQQVFIEKWYGALCDKDPASKGLYEGKAEKLKREIRDPSRRLHEIAGNPLVLTLIAIVHTHRVELPRSRVQIYEDCTQLLLVRWQTRRSPGAPLRSVLEAMREVASPEKREGLENQLLRAVYEVAMRARSGQGVTHGATTLVDERSLEAALAGRVGEEATHIFIDYCKNANGLILAQGLRTLPDRPADEGPVMCFSFPHPSFEEYLAARYLALLDQPAAELARRNAESDRWFFTGVFLAEYFAIQIQRFRELRELVDTLVFANLGAMPEDAGGWRNVWLAGVIWPLVPQEFPDRVDEALEKRVRDLLVRLVVEGRLSPTERADAARALDRLGDPRDFDELVPVPAGRFWMGGEDGDERPRHEVDLPYGYRIGKYPVTVGQWRRFVEDANYRCDPHALAGHRNHPVTWVSWHDARAYSEWLTGEWRRRGRLEDAEVVRLPTEAEWEKAARGGDGREWPWSGEFDPVRVNVWETGIGAICAVGCFPLGSSPCGALDMAGNVWEWCHTLYRPYPYAAEDGREDSSAQGRRVLRGGSFDVSGGGARSAYRFHIVPDGFSDRLGFRVVVSPSAFSGR